MSNPQDDPGTGQRNDDTIHLSLNLEDLEAIDLISLYQLACDQGQFGEADLIRGALMRSLDQYREEAEAEAEAGASDSDDDDDDPFPGS